MAIFALALVVAAQSPHSSLTLWLAPKRTVEGIAPEIEKKCRFTGAQIVPSTIPDPRSVAGEETVEMKVDSLSATPNAMNCFKKIMNNHMKIGGRVPV